MQTERLKFYLVDSTGAQEQLTQFASAYPATLFAIGNLNWSPDGSFLAYWLGAANSTDNQFIWHLMVTEVNSKQTHDYCVQSMDFRPFPSLLWGPESDRIISQINLLDSSINSPVALFLLDENENILMSLECVLFGWINQVIP